MRREIGWHMGELLLAVSLLAPSLAFSQQPTDSSPTQDPGSTATPAQTPSPGPDSNGAQSGPNAAATTQGLFARALNSASPLNGDQGPLQWGWLSVRSGSFLQFYAGITLENAGKAPVSESLNASQLSTSIVLSHAFGASHSTQLTVQYAPSLFIVEGHVYANALNQTAGIDTTFQLSPRWALQISDRFNYFGSQRYFSGLSLNADYSLGTVAQNSFLNGPGRVIYNSASATITYLWSPVTTVSVTPTFGYQDATGVQSTSQNLNAYYGGGQVNVSHFVSASQTIGISYIGQYAVYANTSKIAGPQSNTLLQDFLVTYSKRLSETWRLGLGLGLTNNNGDLSQIGLGANVGITKSFHRMDFALSYNRGHQFNGYVTSASTDRADLINTIRWTRRFTTSSSVAYFRTTGSPISGTSGVYVTEQLNFGLTRSLTLNGNLAYTKQDGDGVYVQRGKTRLASFGITWAPPSSTQN